MLLPRFLSRRQRNNRKEDASRTIHCSFCGESSENVALIVRGPGADICNACVELCYRLCLQRSDKHGDWERLRQFAP